MQTVSRFPRFIAAVTGIALVGTGAWALIAPHSFYDVAATFPAYNRHFVHDIGAFVAALGSALLISLRVRRGLTVALAANTVAAVLHAVSHIVDRDAGGKATDPVFFVVVAAILAIAAAQAMREDSR
jgi:hypothetical protein